MGEQGGSRFPLPLCAASPPELWFSLRVVDLLTEYWAHPNPMAAQWGHVSAQSAYRVYIIYILIYILIDAFCSEQVVNDKSGTRCEEMFY